MFYIFNFSAFLRDFRDSFADRIWKIVKGKEPQDIVDETKERAMKIATDTQFANTEHIKSILRERQNKIDEQFKGEREIGAVKDDVRLRMYKTIWNKQNKDHDLEKSR